MQLRPLLLWLSGGGRFGGQIRHAKMPIFTQQKLPATTHTASLPKVQGCTMFKPDKDSEADKSIP